MCERHEVKVEREARGFALLASMLANANRDPKRRSRPYRIDDFLGRAVEKPRQTPQEQVAILQHAAGGAPLVRSP